MLAAWDPPFFWSLLPYQNLHSGLTFACPKCTRTICFITSPQSSVLDRWRGISKIDFREHLLSFHFSFFVYILCLLFHIEFVSVCTSTPQVYGRSFRSSSTQPFGLRSSRKQVCCCAMLVCHSLSLVHSWWWCFSFFFQGKKNKSLILSLETCPQINH